MSARDIRYSIIVDEPCGCSDINVRLEFSHRYLGCGADRVSKYFYSFLNHSPHANLKAGRKNSAINRTALAPIIESAKGHGLDLLLGDKFYDQLAKEIYSYSETRKFCIGDVNLKDRYWSSIPKPAPKLSVLSLLVELGASNCFQEEFTSMYRHFYGRLADKMLAGDYSYEAEKDTDAVELCEQMLSAAKEKIARTDRPGFPTLCTDLSVNNLEKLTIAIIGVQNLCRQYGITSSEFDEYKSEVDTYASVLRKSLSDTGSGAGAGAGSDSNAPSV